MSCVRPRYFHFILSFYSDPSLTLKVMDVSSVDYWQYFTVNGVPMEAAGALICENDCVQVAFNPPSVALPALAPLFNRRLWVKVSKPIVNFLDATTAPSVKAQIILVVDESSSMQGSHGWIPTMLRLMEQNLMAVGIGPNDYGMVGFGRASDPSPRLFSLITAGHPTPFGSAEALAQLCESGVLETSGGTEDGYLAVNFAWDTFSSVLETNSAINVILITDEDRDIINESVTKATVGNKLTQQGAILSGVNNINFKASDDRIAIGLSSDSEAYVELPAGSVSLYETVIGGVAYNGFGTTDTDYKDLVDQVGGVTWDINVLRDGGVLADTFTQVFVDVQIKQIINSFTCEVAESSLLEFYCPYSESDPVIRIPIAGVPVGCIHARINFYSDSERQNLVHSAFSLNDQRRWYIDQNPPCPLTPYGVYLDSNKSIYYAPEILPANYSENQRTHKIGDSPENIYEKPLLCGVKYYVTVELYYADTGVFLPFADYEYIVNCNSFGDGNWRFNFDAKNWLSSGQGKQDMRLSRTTNQSLFPSVASNWSGQFMIAWQDFRNLDTSLSDLGFNPQVYFGIWDMVTDTISTSGVGSMDYRIFPYGFRPDVSTDIGGVFYVAARRANTIETYSGPLNTLTTDTTSRIITDDTFFNLNNLQDQSEQYLKARIYEADTAGSFVIDDKQTVSVVEDCLIRLDIIGVPGTYAVRLRDENDSDWSDWINIDEERPDKQNNQNDTSKDEDNLLSAYFIDENRFVVPWVLSAGSGMKRVAIQVMTFYGISQTFFLNVLANYKEFEYGVRFYRAFENNAFKDEDEFPTYNGHPVLSTVTKDEHGNASAADKLTVYVRVEFRDKSRLKLYLNKFSTLSRFGTSTITFHVIQQGVNDQYNKTLTVVSGQEGVYSGSFEIEKGDGIYNKDGLAAIVVNVPNPCAKRYSFPCGTDDYDPYNMMNLSVLRDFYVKYDKTVSNITPEQLAEEYRKSGLSRVTSITPLKEFYKADDPRFMFGNPKFFIQDTR